jgi:hypothetical protein
MTASLCPFATHRLMPYADTLPKRTDSKTLILHTNGGGTDKGSLYGWFARAGNDICSHFQVMKDGTIEQYVPIDRQAYAQFSGNAFGVSVETEDDSKPSTPWTAGQIVSIVRLARWLGCPPKIAPNGPDGGGVGYHSLYADWNQSGHDCPGSVRQAQVRSAVIPAIKKAKQPKPRTLPVHVRAAIYLTRRWLDGYSKKHVHPLATPARDRLHALVTSANAAEKAGAK